MMGVWSAMGWRNMTRVFAEAIAGWGFPRRSGLWHRYKRIPSAISCRGKRSSPGRRQRLTWTKPGPFRNVAYAL